MKWLHQKDSDLLLPTAELERRKRLRKVLFDSEYSCTDCGAPIFSDEPVKGQKCLDCIIAKATHDERADAPTHSSAK